MGKKERKVINKKLLSLNPETQRMFRVNSGQGWAGKAAFRKSKIGDAVVIQNPRPFHGMPTGFPDMIGWETIAVPGKFCGSCFHGGYDVECQKVVCFNKGHEIKNVFDDSCDDEYLPRHHELIARFVAREVKATGGLSEDQIKLRETMVSMGVDYDVLTE